MRNTQARRLTGMILSTLMPLLLGCNDKDASNELAVKASAVSECGGFGTSETALTDDAAQAAYCDAEVLEWSYDKAAKTLSLLNTRIILNCCGDHHFATELAEDGAYVITEIDDAQRISGSSEGARCGCMCVFDYEISVEEVPATTIHLKLLRDVEEHDAVDPVWEGTLDLSKPDAADQIIISEESAEPWCDTSGE